MEPVWKYVTKNDEKEIEKFITHHLPTIASGVPQAIFHYTTGDNLIKILGDDELWSTQIACLNDMKEFLYAIEEFHSRARGRLAANSSLQVQPLLVRLNERLSRPSVDSSGIFVTCFSELGDDLSQWRAYAGHVGGYAIKFDARALAASMAQKQVYLLKVIYDST